MHDEPAYENRRLRDARERSGSVRTEMFVTMISRNAPNAPKVCCQVTASQWVRSGTTLDVKDILGGSTR